MILCMADAGRVTEGAPTRNGKTARTEQQSASAFNKSLRERETEREGGIWYSFLEFPPLKKVYAIE